MLREIYSISGRENTSIDARVKFLLDGGEDLTAVSNFLVHNYDSMKVKEAISFYYTGKHKRPLTGSGNDRLLENSVYYQYIDEIKQFITENNNDYRLARDYFLNKYGINAAYIYLVANSMGINTSGKNAHTKNSFKDLMPEIVQMFNEGKSINEVYEKFRASGISKRYISILHGRHAPKEKVRVRRNYGDLKNTIIERLKKGESPEALSEEFGVRKKMIEDWRRMYVGYLYK